MLTLKKELTISIKKKALELGFEKCGISKVEFLKDQENYLNSWIQDKRRWQLVAYMEKNLDLRLDPSKILDGAKSVISLQINYFPESKQNSKYKIAKYAYGQDYHKVIKTKLFELISFINSIQDSCIRAFVDSAPVLEKAWAVRGGLGQIGKNTLLISKTKGSFFFLSELIIDTELEYENSETEDICGDCTLCIDACPTNALFAPYQLDASRCISALTIESKEDIPEEFRGKLKNRIYGCDICQDVCPYNKKANPHNEPLFYPEKALLEMSDDEWENLTEEQFKILFKKSSLKRVGYQRFYNNIQYNKKS